MSPFRPYTRPCSAAERGFAAVETLVALVITTLGIAMAMSLLLAGSRQVREQGKELETSQATRAVMDLLLRELRLGGACLPVTGKFVSLAGADGGDSDEITVRSGLTRNDLSCIRAATTVMAAAASSVLSVDDSGGFAAGMRVYLRQPNGSGVYARIAAVDAAARTLTLETPLSGDFPPTTGVYAITERRFFLGTRTLAGASVPELLVAVDGGTPYSFALGTETLDIRYELNDGSVVALPADDGQWSSVNRILLRLTVRSLQPDPDGTYYRRSLSATTKPRNLIET
jgi:hypothetical protein